MLVAFLFFCGLFLPLSGQAATSGKATPVASLAGIKVHIYAKQGGEWFIALTKDINKNGVLKVENVLPGWGKIELAGSKKNAVNLAGKTFVSKMKLLDEKGRRIKKKTDVDLYAKIGGVKTYLATMKTDREGWLIVPGSMIGVENYIHVRGDGEPLGNSRGQQPRINVDAKMDDGKWFRVAQDKLDRHGVLTIENARPGKTKFSYVKGDGEKISGADLIDSLNQSGKLSDKLAEKFKLSDFAAKSFEKPFTLKVQVLDDDGNRVKKGTKVKMTVYLKNRTLKGTLRTGAGGWLTIKGVPTGIETKMKIDD